MARLLNGEHLAVGRRIHSVASGLDSHARSQLCACEDRIRDLRKIYCLAFQRGIQHDVVLSSLLGGNTSSSSARSAGSNCATRIRGLFLPSIGGLKLRTSGYVSHRLALFAGDALQVGLLFFCRTVAEEQGEEEGREECSRDTKYVTQLRGHSASGQRRGKDEGLSADIEETDDGAAYRTTW